MNKVKLPPLTIQELNALREFLSRCLLTGTGTHGDKAIAGILALLYQKLIGMSVFPKKETRISIPVHTACAIIHAWKSRWHLIGPHEPHFDMFMPNIIMYMDRQIL